MKKEHKKTQKKNSKNKLHKDRGKKKWSKKKKALAFVGVTTLMMYGTYKLTHKKIRTLWDKFKVDFVKYSNTKTIDLEQLNYSDATHIIKKFVNSLFIIDKEKLDNELKELSEFIAKKIIALDRKTIDLNTKSKILEESILDINKYLAEDNEGIFLKEKIHESIDDVTKLIYELLEKIYKIWKENQDYIIKQQNE